MNMKRKVLDLARKCAVLTFTEDFLYAIQLQRLSVRII